jgi:hypothetical protein
MRKVFDTKNEFLWNTKEKEFGDTIYFDLSECYSMGDAICSTPTIRKVSEAYNSKINIITKFPELFKHNPYIKNVYHPDTINFDYLRDNFLIHSSFYNVGKQNDKGIQTKHARMDIRQFHAHNLGFSLLPNEMECEYYADPFEPIDGLPEKYVLIHPATTWQSRTWDIKEWMSLTEKLNEQGISVVSIGKDTDEVGFWHIEKKGLNIDIKLGLNLMNQTNISQSWHLIQKSICFITMDSGLLHLAGTTDVNIIQLGSSINPYWRIPYRKGSQDYKFNYVGGSCDIFCASELKYGVSEWGSIQGVAPLIYCLEKKPTFECHPKHEQVISKILNLI